MTYVSIDSAIDGLIDAYTVYGRTTAEHLTQLAAVQRFDDSADSISIRCSGRTICVYHSGNIIGAIVVAGSKILHDGLPSVRSAVPVGRARLIVCAGDYLRHAGFGQGPGAAQTHFRNRAQNHAAAIVLPFESLSSAGIDVESIEPIDVMEDRTETIRRSSPNANDVPDQNRSYGFVHPTTGEPCNEGNHVWPDDVKRERRSRYRRSVPLGPVGSHQGTWTYPDGRPVHVPGPAYACRYVRTDSPDSSGLYHWTEYRHHLGESLFRASWSIRSVGPEETVTTNGRSLFYSGFDTETARSGRPVFGRIYFLAQLPQGSTARTVSEAVEALKPDLVRARERQGFQVHRQGDIFLIETDYATSELRADGATFGRRSVHPDIARYREANRNRTARLADIERYTSILADESELAAIAERKGWTLDHARQVGESELERFRDSLAVSDLILARMDARVQVLSERYAADGRIEPTGSHSALEVASLPDGRTYARGTVTHWNGRLSEHRPVRLGSVWFRVVQNTVPFVDGRARAWTVEGRVD